jgi:hypothetical protein
MIDHNRIVELAKESLASPPAEMPKKKYSMPASQPEVEIAQPAKAIDRTKLESDLYELVYAAGGQAPGYRRQLNKILDQYL